MRTPRRWINRVLGFGLLGLATTVAVAWALAAWAPHRATRVVWYRVEPRAGSRVVWATVAEYRRPGVMRREANLDSVGPLSDPGLLRDWAPPHAGDYEFLSAPQRGALRWGLPEPGVAGRLKPKDSNIVDDARGWPLLAMRCRCTLIEAPGAPGRGRSVVTGGIRLGPEPGPAEWWAIEGDRGDFRALPLIPVWTGLAGGTLFYAMLWAALLLALAWLRGNLRRSRGLCPRCAYELAEAWRNGCPECGWRKAHNTPAPRAS